MQVGKKKLMPLETEEWEVRINTDSGSMTSGLPFLLQSEGAKRIKILAAVNSYCEEKCDISLQR